jgi:hypothetical protein
MDELRDEIYGWCLKLLEKGFKWESIFLMLSTWNFAHFRYHIRNFNELHVIIKDIYNKFPDDIKNHMTFGYPEIYKQNYFPKFDL